MAPERRFARLRPGVEAPGPGLWVVPSEGMCLSAFLIVRPPDRDRHVLLGRLDPSAPWLDLGGLEPERAQRFGDGWMLPSSQLLLFESPEAAAERIAREQLGVALPPLEDFSVHSEAYHRSGTKEGDPHWDLHFLYCVRWPDGRPPRTPAWRELRFVDLDTLAGSDLVRAQGDILSLAGLAPRGPAGPERTR